MKVINAKCVFCFLVAATERVMSIKPQESGRHVIIFSYKKNPLIAGTSRINQNNNLIKTKYCKLPFELIAFSACRFLVYNTS